MSYPLTQFILLQDIWTPHSLSIIRRKIRDRKLPVHYDGQGTRTVQHIRGHAAIHHNGQVHGGIHDHGRPALPRRPLHPLPILLQQNERCGNPEKFQRRAARRPNRFQKFGTKQLRNNKKCCLREQGRYRTGSLRQQGRYCAGGLR